MDIAVLVGYLLSVSSIVVLAVLDPKRKRTLRGKHWIVWLRRGLLLILLYCGIALAVEGGAATFVVWVGVVSIAGWLAAWIVNWGSPVMEDS